MVLLLCMAGESAGNLLSHGDVADVHIEVCGRPDQARLVIGVWRTCGRYHPAPLQQVVVRTGRNEFVVRGADEVDALPRGARVGPAEPCLLEKTLHFDNVQFVDTVDEDGAETEREVVRG